jgi:iron(III) transport system ATP-binding protein
MSTAAATGSTDTISAAGAGAVLDVTGLQKSYFSNGREVPVVKDVTFRIEPGHFYSLLGPSGCGKTTTLRCVAGLELSDGGSITLAGQALSQGKTHLPPNKRDIGMVFQNYAIWPHMTVFANAVFPLQVAGEKLPKDQAKARVMECLELVQLDHLAQRPAVALSGGQQQRLALARALVRRPKLLLLDEPLSNLDAKLRDTMRTELRALQRRLGITTLYVTHDQSEALSMSDRVAVMHDGRILQEGSPREIYDRPAARFVADFVGRANMIPAEVIRRISADEVVVRALGIELRTPCVAPASVGDRITVSMRPESVRAHETAPDRPNVIAGRVSRVEFLGEIVEYDVSVTAGADRHVVVVRTSPLSVPAEGSDVYLEIAPHICRVLQDEAS